MAGPVTIGILSDIHYAGAAEKARGNGYEVAGIPNPLLRLFVRAYRRFFWLHHPLHQGYLLDDFLAQPGHLDYLVALGDFTCDSAFVGLSDPAAAQSAGECLSKLRARFAERLLPVFGDHELGKLSFIGGRGGMRLASWRAALALGLEPFWRLNVGQYVLLGITSSLVALPVFAQDLLVEEKAEWERLRAEHLAQIRAALASLRPSDRVLLFCHDPTALPFLAREPEIRPRLSRIEHTIIGHLHSNLILWKSRLLAGIPRLTFLGHTARRLSTALREARLWHPFHVRLCPSLAGIELLKDGGYLTAALPPEPDQPVIFRFHPVPRGKTR